MAKRNFFDELEVKARDEKESTELEKEYSKHLADRSKMEAEANSLDREILAERDDLDNAIVCMNRPQVDAATERLNKVVRRKMSIRDDYFRKGEALRGKLESLSRAYRDDAIRVIDRLLEGVKRKYTLTIPSARTNVQGKIIETPWREEIKTFGEKHPVELTVRYVLAQSNASAIVEYKELCISARMKVIKCFSLKQLKAVLDDLNAGVSVIDLEPKQVRITEEDLEKLNPGSYREVAFLTHAGTSKVKPEPVSKTIVGDDFFSQKR